MVKCKITEYTGNYYVLKYFVIPCILSIVVQKTYKLIRGDREKKTFSKEV